MPLRFRSVRILLTLGAATLLLGAGGCPASRSAVDEDAAAASADAALDAPRVGRPPRDAGPLYDVYVDPGCDGGPLVDGGSFMRECDPFTQDCPEAQGCYPAPMPPSGPCGDEVFVTFCRQPGPGRQGDSCIEARCATGYACVVTGEGTQCALICHLSGGEPACPRGYLCRATDVPGYGVCG